MQVLRFHWVRRTPSIPQKLYTFGKVWSLQKIFGRAKHGDKRFTIKRGIEIFVGVYKFEDIASMEANLFRSSIGGATK